MRDVNTLAIAFPEASLRSLAGRAELAVAEATARPGTRPERVSRVLSAIYETIACQPATPEFVRRLPGGTRESLLQRAAARLRPDITWFEAVCTHCGQPYDVSLDLSSAEHYSPDGCCSTVEVETSLGTRSFQVPNGAHEEAFARQALLDDDDRRTFASLCGLSEQADEEARQFDEHDLALIDEALERASPDVADETWTACPSCGHETAARIDPLVFAFPRESDILHETHTIASEYGWPHNQILDLSARHRSFFASMIARDYRSTGRSTGWRSE